MGQYVRSESVVSRMIAGETLIVPITKGVGDLASIYSLNPVASTIWNVISRPCSVEEISQLIAREFEAESEQIEHDVKQFLLEMESAGLVTEVGVPAFS